MSDIEPVLSSLTAENLALRSLLTGLLIEMVRMGHIGLVSNAFAYANAPLEGLTRETRLPQETRQKAGELLLELRAELLGGGDADRRQTFVKSSKPAH